MYVMNSIVQTFNTQKPSRPYFKNDSIGRWLNGLACIVMLYFSTMLLPYEAKKT